MGIKLQPPRISQLGNLLLFIAGASFLAYLFIPRSSGIPLRPYSEFLEQIERGEVKQVQIGSEKIIYLIKIPEIPLSNPEDLLKGLDNPLEVPQESQNPFYGKQNSPATTSPQARNNRGQILSTIAVNDPQLVQKLREKNVVFAAALPPKNGWLITLATWVVPPLILVAALRYLQTRGSAEDKRTLLFRKSQAKVYVEGESEKITFADVAGVEEAKTELAEIVEFLKNPDRFTKIGARIPKGVLLVGPPGTGKTLMAKAVAGEAGVAFFSISASEFVELFVGTGAARVRDLFEQAKKQAPCIIFIDELDAIGKSRSGGAGFPSGSNDEREQTLNQLLTEMDGFSAGDAIVIVLAATNRPEALDAALLRPGRFDRQVLVDRPDLAGRLKILEIYAEKVQLDAEVDLRKIATRTPGFAGADLANLVNEAALLAARKKEEKVSQQDFNEAIERVIAGLEKKSRVLSEKEKKVVAYHEVGHALVGAVMPGGGKVEKISIVPRGIGALGYTLKLPTEDRFLMDEKEFHQQIAMLLGGRAAEVIVFGNVTNGAADDLQRATALAERMVTSYGMSKILGPLAYEKGQRNNFLGNHGINNRRHLSEETAKAIDREVKQIVETNYQTALKIINHNRDLLETISQKILQVEVIEGEDLQQLLAQVNW